MSSVLEVVVRGKQTHVRATGKLTKQAYEELVPVIDEQIQEHGKVRILFELQDFHGWTAGALWEDMKFDLRHWKDIERLAIVGDSRWEQAMAVFCTPFTSATIRYFDHTALDDAQSWLESD